MRRLSQERKDHARFNASQFIFSSSSRYVKLSLLCHVIFCEFVRLERICLAIAYFFENLDILSHILDDSLVLGTVHFILGRGG